MRQRVFLVRRPFGPSCLGAFVPTQGRYPTISRSFLSTVVRRALNWCPTDRPLKRRLNR